MTLRQVPLDSCLVERLAPLWALGSLWAGRVEGDFAALAARLFETCPRLDWLGAEGMPDDCYRIARAARRAALARLPAAEQVAIDRAGMREHGDTEELSLCNHNVWRPYRPETVMPPSLFYQTAGWEPDPFCADDLPVPEHRRGLLSVSVHGVDMSTA